MASHAQKTSAQVRQGALGGRGLARPSALQHTIVWQVGTAWGSYLWALHGGAASSLFCVLTLSDPCRTPLQQPPAPWAAAHRLPTACMETLAWDLELRPVRRHRWGTAHRRALGPCLFWQAARSPSIGHLVRCALHACHCSKTILQPWASQCLLLLHKSRRAEAPRSLCAEAGINLSFQLASQDDRVHCLWLTWCNDSRCAAAAEGEDGFSAQGRRQPVSVQRGHL